MPQLKELQKNFAKAIYQESDLLIDPHIKDKGISKEARLQIYRDNSFIVLTNTLKNTYPAICTLVDEQFFNYAANEYIKQYPSISGNLDDYGAAFPEFLGQFEATKSFPYLGDVARLEWLRHQAYLAADAEPLDREALAKVTPENYEKLTFTLHPSTFLISSPYPIDFFWEIAQEVSPSDEEITMPSRGVDILVVRPEFKIEQYLLEKGEYNFLKALKNGNTLADAFEAINIEDFDAGNAIQKFVLNRILVKFSL